MSSRVHYMVHEGSLERPAVGVYHHDQTNALAGPEPGDIIKLEGQIGRWRVTAEPQGTAELVAERVEDDLVTPHGD